jgi:hypothetical protein
MAEPLQCANLGLPRIMNFKRGVFRFEPHQSPIPYPNSYPSACLFPCILRKIDDDLDRDKGAGKSTSAIWLVGQLSPRER